MAAELEAGPHFTHQLNFKIFAWYRMTFQRRNGWQLSWKVDEWADPEWRRRYGAGGRCF